jgi:hypothetical protein
MRRPPLGVLLAATIAFAACGEPSDHALGPQLPAQPVRPPLAADLAPCPTATGVDSQITALFSGGNQTAALSKFANIVALLDSTPPGEDTVTAQAHTLDLIGFALQKFEAGTLTGGLSSGTQNQVVALVNGLLCFAGLPQGFNSGDLGSDGAWAIISPTTPDTTVTTGNLHAGLQVDSGSVTQTVLVTITRLPDSPGPLATQLDQYPLFYEFSVTPQVPFTLPVLVGACQSQGLPDSVVPGLQQREPPLVEPAGQPRDGGMARGHAPGRPGAAARRDGGRGRHGQDLQPVRRGGHAARHDAELRHDPALPRR